MVEDPLPDSAHGGQTSCSCRSGVRAARSFSVPLARETLSRWARLSPAAQPATLAESFCLQAGPGPAGSAGEGFYAGGALRAPVMSLRLPDTQLWGRVSKASSWPGDAVCGVSMWGAHGLSAVTEAGISGLWAVKRRRPGLKAHSSAAAFRGEVILPGTSCLRYLVFLKDYHNI